MTEDIEEFVAACLDNDQSVKSTRNYLQFPHSVFDFALRKGWVAGNPCKAVEKPEVADEDRDICFLEPAVTQRAGGVSITTRQGLWARR